MSTVESLIKLQALSKLESKEMSKAKSRGAPKKSHREGDDKTFKSTFREKVGSSKEINRERGAL